MNLNKDRSDSNFRDWLKTVRIKYIMANKHSFRISKDLLQYFRYLYDCGDSVQDALRHTSIEPANNNRQIN